MDLAKLNPITLAVPFFVLLIFVELLVSRLRQSSRERKIYRLNDSIAALTTALVFSITGVAVTAASLWWYSIVESHWSLPVLWSGFAKLELANAAWWHWLLILLAVDFLYYWFHRASHEIRFLWACHVTHHSSEEFNLTTALRQCSFQRVFEYMFMLPLALLGIPWQMMFICHGILKIYQFWVHTRLIGRLSFLEHVLLTPSHHRVHHGRDPQYLDKNHGGIFILWDRWFGSYAPEVEEPHYGLVKPLRSWNPLWANVHEYAGIFRDMWRTRGWRNRLRVALGAPGWRPDDLGGPLHAEVVAPDYQKYDPNPGRAALLYAFVQFLLLAGASMVFLRLARGAAGLPDWPVALLVVSGVYLVLALTTVGAMLTVNNESSTRLESLRLLAGLGLSIAAYYGGWISETVLVVFVVVHMASLVWCRVVGSAKNGTSFDAPVPAGHRVS